MSSWNYLYASVIGKSHIDGNIECQDYCNVFKHRGYDICIVSDGAGSCENSKIGSENVTKLANEHFAHLIDKKQWNKNSKITSKEWKAESKKALKKIRNELEKYFTPQYSFKSLSCTLIVVINLKKKLLITHIGDGRAGYCDNDDNWQSMMTPYKGNYNNATVFITSDIWDNEEMLDKYIESSIIEKKIKAFCLLSDGCENSAFECYKIDEESKIPIDLNVPYKNFFSQNVNTHIPNLVKAKKSQEEMNEIWHSFLEHGNDTLKNEPDDKSMILAVRVNNPKHK